MRRQVLIVRILRGILGGTDEQHVLAKMSNAWKRVAQLADVNVHGGRSFVGFRVGDQEHVHGEMRGVVIFFPQDHVLVVALINRGRLDVMRGC